MTTPGSAHGRPAAGSVGLPPEDAARLRAVPFLVGRPWRAQPLGGGLTNTNYRVSTADGEYVARLASPTADLLAIDRVVEHQASMAAAAAGVAPRVVDHASTAGVLLIEWIEGRTYTERDVGANLDRIALSCRRLHAGPRFSRDFDMFAVQRGYLEVVRARGFRLPPRYLEFMPIAERIQAALSVRTEPSVPCHNDLLAANFIDDGRQVWLIDYEYAGNNDPCFELGNLWSESGLHPDQLVELVTAYYGRPWRPKVARARLLGLMAKYGWMLWASIQHGVSTIDFDFWSWGMEKYDRAVAEFDGPELDRWIEDVQRVDG